jgi:hypothetical protein
VVLGIEVYNDSMPNTLEILEKHSKSLITAGVRPTFVPTSHAVITANRGNESVTLPLEPEPKPAFLPVV